MTWYVDTSALYALVDADDRFHGPARREWIGALENGASDFVCSNYVIVEAAALVQSRLGMDALMSFQGAVLPVVHTEWVDPEVHNAGMAALLTASRRDLSLVDCVSFEIMRRLDIDTAFTFDEHFSGQGFRMVPSV